MNPVAASSVVSQLGQIQEAARNRAAGGMGQTGSVDKGGGFAEMLQNYVQQTNDAQVVSDVAVKDFATGKTDNVEQVVLAMTQADMSFQLFMEIRNKLIDSYNELMRMQF